MIESIVARKYKITRVTVERERSGNYTENKTGLCKKIKLDCVKIKTGLCKKNKNGLCEN